MTTLIVLCSLTIVSLALYGLFREKLDSVRLFRNSALSFKGLIRALCLATVAWGIFTALPFNNTTAIPQQTAETAAPASTTEQALASDAAGTTEEQESDSVEEADDTDSDDSTEAERPATQTTVQATAAQQASKKANTAPAATASTTAATAATAASAPAAATAPAVTPATRFKDGVYTGTAQGFKAPITVEVEVRNDAITRVDVVSQRDDARWFDRANSVIPQSIISAQSAQVDTVSGATYSSRGIINAAAQAIQKALN